MAAKTSCSACPWILSDTELSYLCVMCRNVSTLAESQAVGLLPDLDLLEDADLTEIGERSGGPL
jgi:hypothetical protein